MYTQTNIIEEDFMKKFLVSSLCASFILTGVVGTSGTFAATKEGDTSTQVITTTLDNQEVKVAYDKEFIIEELKNSSGNFDLVLPYKEGNIEVPKGYHTILITNPETQQSFYRISSEYQTFGLKKWAIVNGFRYGGEALSVVLDVVSPDTAKYVKKNSGKIADAIDSASEMLHGEIYQALLSAGVPTFYARNIAWAIDAFLL